MIVSITTRHSMIVCVSFAEEADGVEVVSLKVGDSPCPGLYKGGRGLRPKVEAGRASQRVESTTGLRDRGGGSGYQ